MLNFFRRLTKSKAGGVIALFVLIVIGLAFAAGDINNVRGSNQAAGGSVATIGNTAVGEAALRQDVQNAFQGYRQQQPTLDMATFVTQGGFDQVLDRRVNALALQRFGESIGLAASKRAIDGEIASIPAFQGFDGKFSQANYDAILRQQQMTDKGLREDIARDMLARQLVAPTAGARQIPAQLATPYASLLLERRQGSVGFIPVSTMAAGTPPTDAELQTYYTRQRARYTIPERRVLRYAVLSAASLAGGAKPTPAEIAAAYNQQRAKYAPSERRTITQVVVADQAAANALAQKVKGGASMKDAARAAGLEASTAADVEKAALVTQTSQAIADAAFGATASTVLGPLRSPLGWHVVRVDSIQKLAGKSLAEATPELTAELTKVKAQQAITTTHDKLDDAISGGATFDEVIGDNKLSAQATPAITAAGQDPAAPTAQPNPLFARLAQAGFAAEQGDAPQLVPTDADGSFAVVGVGRVLPAAPPPLAQIKDRVTQDFIVDRNLRKARALAVAAVAKIDKGVSLDEALRETGVKVPLAQKLNASRAELARQGGQLPPPVALMFSMAAKRAKMLEAPQRGGYFVVYLDAIQPGNAATNQTLVTSTRNGLGGVIGSELSEQFVAAVRNTVGVKRNAAAIARVRSELAGGGAPAN
jgi:peptidyl-prolyl cis-trans isomerase D